MKKGQCIYCNNKTREVRIKALYGLHYEYKHQCYICFQYMTIQQAFKQINNKGIHI